MTTRTKSVVSYKKIILRIIILLLVSMCFYRSKFTNITYIHSQSEDQFPFVGQKSIYEITQTTGSIIAASGTLTLTYNSMLNVSNIRGSFHVDVLTLVEYYNETAFGNENLNTRALYIDAGDTSIIQIFMVYFFEFIDDTTKATPMWVFPEDLQLNKTIAFWNYTAICSKSQSIAIMDKYYEVFVFRIYGSMVNMTLMYGYGKHGTSDWYGLLFYMSGTYFEPAINRRMNAYFKLASTNVELLPLDELNKATIFSITASFYSIVFVGTVVYRIKTRKELIGGEV
ncbi:MAG: hypothetical protein FK731_14980 [Asgard group archaeon]|nr:hypothetical protein [Asgard group archaeon]